MDQEKVGKFIKEIRIQNHLTQKELADKLGVTFQAVSKWENGKNIPDIALLKEISDMFHINIDDILNGENIKKTKKNFLPWIIVFTLFIIILIIIFVPKKNNNFEFKTLAATCDDFKITGSAAYNQDKSSIYISNIEFCGEENNEIYASLECTLYESYKDTITKISDGLKRENMTLEDYVKDVKINVDHYSSVCKEFSSSNLYLEIHAIDFNQKTTTYKIPISLEDNC